MSFVRTENDDAIYRIKTISGETTKDEFMRNVPLLDFKTSSKIQLINELEQLNSRGQYEISKFRHWACIEKKGIFGNIFSFDVTNIYRNVLDPKFIIIRLQKNRANNQ